MKNIKFLLMVLIISCTFGCSKEGETVIEKKTKSTVLKIDSDGPISEYKIISRDTKKVIAHVKQPKAVSKSQRPDLTYVIKYEENIDLASTELLTIQIPVTKELKRFTITTGGSYYYLLKLDQRLNAYYIDFVSPTH